MNLNLKELATEVGISVDYLENTKQLMLLEKFAELVIEASFDTVIADGRFHDARRVIRSAKYVAMEHFRS